MQLVANLSLMFAELPMLDRLAAARGAGFDQVEMQFPYEYDLEEIAAAKDDAGMEIVLINLPAGDLASGEAGLTALPGREQDYRSVVELGIEYARRLGAKKINSLAGKPADPSASEVFRTACENLRYAAAKFAEIGAMVLVEPVNPVDVPGFYLTRLQAALDLIEAVDRDNVKLLFDLYHMEQTEPSLAGAIRHSAPVIGHVQFADTPGRHEPGTGVIDFEIALKVLKDTRYDGHVSAEYRATGQTADSLAWMDDFRRWAR